MRKRTRVIGAVSVAALTALGLSLPSMLPAGAVTGQAPTATLGIWTSAEDSGAYSTVAGQHPNIANFYLAWGQSWPAAFIAKAQAQGATPFIELEPWHAGPDWNQTPSMADIGSNTASDCGSDGTSSCEAWLDSIGQDVKSFGHPVIFTFAHEFNVRGQYPWAWKDSEETTPAQWIKAWDTVETDVDNSAGRPNAWWMWVPNVDSGDDSAQSATTAFAPWWPGAQYVDMVGLDGYPYPAWGLHNFQDTFAKSFTEMKALTSLPIFIAETDLAYQTGSGGTQTVTQFVQSALADGATGLLQYQDDGLQSLTAAQWSALDAALAAAPKSPVSGTPETGPPSIVAAVSGRQVEITWGTVGGATGYEVQVARPGGGTYKDSKVAQTHAVYDAVPKNTGEYHYKIRAYNANGDGPWSAVKSFTVAT